MDLVDAIEGLKHQLDNQTQLDAEEIERLDQILQRSDEALVKQIHAVLAKHHQRRASIAALLQEVVRERAKLETIPQRPSSRSALSLAEHEIGRYLGLESTTMQS